MTAMQIFHSTPVQYTAFVVDNSSLRSSTVQYPCCHCSVLVEVSSIYLYATMREM